MKAPDRPAGVGIDLRARVKSLVGQRQYAGLITTHRDDFYQFDLRAHSGDETEPGPRLVFDAIKSLGIPECFYRLDESQQACKAGRVAQLFGLFNRVLQDFPETVQR